jgi:hypothetical protein
MPNDTLNHGSIVYNVWYVDPSGSNGDGLTPATAFNVLPAPASIPESACYIIRRNSSAVTMTFAGATSSTQYLMIIGMPLSTDDLYQEVPAAAKTAWDADDPTVLWANIKLTADATMHRSNNYQFILDRIHIYRNTGLGASNYNFYFDTTCNRWANNIVINRCKFSSLGYDMSVPGYSTMIPENTEYSYVYVDCTNNDQTGCNSFVLTNSIINAGKPTDAVHYCFAVCNPRYVNMSGNTIHQVGAYVYAEIFYFGHYSSFYSYENFESAIYDNNTLTLWLNGNISYSGQFGMCLYSSKANYTSIRNWTITDSTTVLGGVGLRPTACVFGCPLIKIDDLRSFDIKNISINITQWNDFSLWQRMIVMGGTAPGDNSRFFGPSILSFAGLCSGSMEGYVRNISDITINLPDNPVIPRSESNLNWDKFNGNTNYDNYCFAMHVIFSISGENSVSSSWNGSNSYYPYKHNAKSLVKLTNININNYQGRAIHLSGVAAILGDIKGQVYCTGGAVATINSISTWFPGGALMLYANYAYGACIVQVGTITVNKSNITYPYTNQLAVSFGTSSGGSGTPYQPRNNMVYIGTCNSVTATNVGSSSPANDNISYPNRFPCICANEVATGNYVMRTWNYIVNTWSTYRTGGAPASLKMFQNVCSSWVDWLFIGPDPYSAMVITPGTTGKKYVEMHIAFKGYGDPQNYFNNVQFIVKFKNTTGNGSYSYKYSNAEGIWTDDSASTWNGDSGLTQYKCRIPIDVQTLDPIDVKMGFNWYGASGYLYLDPLPQLVDIV